MMSLNNLKDIVSLILQNILKKIILKTIKILSLIIKSINNLLKKLVDQILGLFMEIIQNLENLF